MGAPESIVASVRHPAEWCEPAAITLDGHGMICDCSKAGEELFGYSLPEMAWRHVTSVLPQIGGNLVQDGQFNPQLAFLSRCGYLFPVQNREGSIIPSQLSFVTVGHAGKFMLRMIIHRPANAAA